VSPGGGYDLTPFAESGQHGEHPLGQGHRVGVRVMLDPAGHPLCLFADAG
jgi:hypothetical protein